MLKLYYAAAFRSALFYYHCIAEDNSTKVVVYRIKYKEKRQVGSEKKKLTVNVIIILSSEIYFC